MAKRIIIEKIELGNSGGISKDKINNNFNQVANVLDILDGETVKKSNVTSSIGFSQDKVPNEYAVSKEISKLNIELSNKANKDDVAISMINKGSVATVANLPSNATKGDAYYVESESFIYQFDGSRWNKTIFTKFPSNVATKDITGEQLYTDAREYIHLGSEQGGTVIPFQLKKGQIFSIKNTSGITGLINVSFRVTADTDALQDVIVFNTVDKEYTYTLPIDVNYVRLHFLYQNMKVEYKATIQHSDVIADILEERYTKSELSNLTTITENQSIYHDWFIEGGQIFSIENTGISGRCTVSFYDKDGNRVLPDVIDFTGSKTIRQYILPTDVYGVRVYGSVVGMILEYNYTIKKHLIDLAELANRDKEIYNDLNEKSDKTITGEKQIYTDKHRMQYASEYMPKPFKLYKGQIFSIKNIGSAGTVSVSFRTDKDTEPYQDVIRFSDVNKEYSYTVLEDIEYIRIWLQEDKGIDVEYYATMQTSGILNDVRNELYKTTPIVKYNTVSTGEAWSIIEERFIKAGNIFYIRNTGGSGKLVSISFRDKSGTEIFKDVIQFTSLNRWHSYKLTSDVYYARIWTSAVTDGLLELYNTYLITNKEPKEPKRLLYRADLPKMSKIELTTDPLSSWTNDKTKHPAQIKYTDTNGKTIEETDGEASYQGNSTMAHPKKNFRIKFKSGKQKFGNWVETDKFNLKAYWTDPVMLREPIINQVAYMANMCNPYINQFPWRGETLIETGARGNVDLFPCELWINGTFQGFYFFGLAKDGNNYQLDKNNVNHAALEGTNQVATFWTQYNAGNWEMIAPDDMDSEVESNFSDFIFFIGNSNDAEFKTQASNYLKDLTKWIDYYIVCEMFMLVDNLAKNITMQTRNKGVSWIPFVYDGDLSFMILATSANASVLTQAQAQDLTIWNKLLTNFRPEINNRFKVLYDNGILTFETIEQLFIDIQSGIPKTVWDKEVSKWSAKYANVSGAFKVSGLINYYKNRLVWAKQYFSYE